MKGAKIIRAVQPSFGAAYGLITANYIDKYNDKKDKLVLNANPLQLFAIFPTPIGLRLGVNFYQMDYKGSYKLDGSTTDIKLKSSIQKISVSAAAALQNGFGAAITLSTNKEESSTNVGSSSSSKDANYGLLIPQIYFAGDNFETILTWTPSQRHDTGTNDGTYELLAEYGTSDIHPYLNVTRYRNSENDGERESDHFHGLGGIRYILDRESNIRFLLLGEEAYYTDRSHASASNCAQNGLSVAGEHVIGGVHVLGYGLTYILSSGKGLESHKYSSTLNSDLTGIVGSYKFVLR